MIHAARSRPGHTTWHALGEARRQLRPRRAFVVDGERVGSVDEAHLPALRRWPCWVEIGGQAVVLTVAAPGRDEALAEMNVALRAQGLVRAWRDEPFPLLSPSSGRVLAVFERASARFWGTLTLGAHCNGWVAGADGQPAHLWIARRSPTKATDPGLLDNLIGGGVPHGQTPRQAAVREGFEEAGLKPWRLRALQRGRVIELYRDIPEGLQFERLHVFDLQLPPTLVPANQDGEVAELRCLPLAEAVERAASPQMTVDASLVTLDFLLRRELLAQAGVPRAADLAAALAPMLRAGREPHRPREST